MATAPLLQDIYTCTPRQARKAIVDCVQAGLVPFVKSSPGVGKSTLMRGVNDQFNLHMIDHRLSTSAPEDLSGLPTFVNGMATFAPFDLFPIESTPLPDGKDGWMIFLDEANSGTKMVQAACYKLILDKMVGQHKLHPNVIITMAGNLATDRALVNPLSTAMQSRVIHIKMVANLIEWMEDVAFAQGYDERIIAYMNHIGLDALMNFRPDHQDETFACPRTWEFMQRLIAGKEFKLHSSGAYDMEANAQLYAGAIGPGIAADFIQFTKVFHEIVKIEDVIRDPTNAPIPASNQANFALICHLGNRVTEATFDRVSTYVNRLGLTYRILFFRTVKSRLPSVRHHPAFATAMVELSNYLHGA